MGVCRASTTIINAPKRLLYVVSTDVEEQGVAARTHTYAHSKVNTYYK